MPVQVTVPVGLRDAPATLKHQPQLADPATYVVPFGTFIASVTVMPVASAVPALESVRP